MTPLGQMSLLRSQVNHCERLLQRPFADAGQVRHDRAVDLIALLDLRILHPAVIVMQSSVTNA